MNATDRDPHPARLVMQHLHVDDLPQRPLTMGAADGDPERINTGRLIRHNGDPVLRQHFGNVVTRRAASGLVRKHKASTASRIDAAVASAMAVSRAVSTHNTRSTQPV